MEIKLRSALHRAGFRFRKNVNALTGKPDIVFPTERVAVFVDGDYWHARTLKEFGIDALRKSLKTTNSDFWMAKLEHNHKRDLAVTAELTRQGWVVVSLWETDLKKDMNRCVRAVVSAVNQRRNQAH